MLAVAYLAWRVAGCFPAARRCRAVLAVLAALAACRGPWDAADPRSPAKMALLLLATILASYHSHAYGPILLLAPVATMFATGQGSRVTRAALLGAAVLPSLLWVTVFKWYIVALTVLLVICFGALLAEVWRGVPGSGRHRLSLSFPGRG